MRNTILLIAFSILIAGCAKAKSVNDGAETKDASKSATTATQKEADTSTSAVDKGNAYVFHGYNYTLTMAVPQGVHPKCKPIENANIREAQLQQGYYVSATCELEGMSGMLEVREWTEPVVFPSAEHGDNPEDWEGFVDVASLEDRTLALDALKAGYSARSADVMAPAFVRSQGLLSYATNSSGWTNYHEFVENQDARYRGIAGLVSTSQDAPIVNPRIWIMMGNPDDKIVIAYSAFGLALEDLDELKPFTVDGIGEGATSEEDAVRLEREGDAYIKSVMASDKSTPLVDAFRKATTMMRSLNVIRD